MSAPTRSAAAMDVQIFGTRACADTRKALRFFSDRRVGTHFVDLKQRAASKGELGRFARKFGVEALVDRESKRFEALGLRQAHYGEARWLQLLEEEPMLLRTPLVRRGSEVTVGLEEDVWKGWTA
jgi:arsenate reductase